MAQNDSSKSAVCFLLIGQLEELPRIAIQSALDRTTAPIFVGILESGDFSNLPSSSRINFIKLDLNVGDATLAATAEYQDFSTDNFYQIVQYKWQLLLKLMEFGYEYVIYSDTDVYWNLNPLPVIEQVFQDRPNVQVQIQSFTDDPSDPKLCMGFVAFRVSTTNIRFIESCAEQHSKESSKRTRVGDDEVVTSKFKEDGFPSSILELPQTTFPVGRMLKLYRNKSIMPGLGSPNPYIFHANYVVGLTNKLILIKLFIKNYSSFDQKRTLGLSLQFLLTIKRIRLFLHKLKVAVLPIANSN